MPEGILRWLGLNAAYPHFSKCRKSLLAFCVHLDRKKITYTCDVQGLQARISNLPLSHFMLSNLPTALFIDSQTSTLHMHNSTPRESLPLFQKRKDFSVSTQTYSQFLKLKEVYCIKIQFLDLGAKFYMESTRSFLAFLYLGDFLAFVDIKDF